MNLLTYKEKYGNINLQLIIGYSYIPEGKVSKSTTRNQVKPDTILKNFWKNNQRFADLFNTVLFNGKPVLKPSDLKEVDTDVSSVIKFNNHAETVQRILDVVRKTAYGVDFIIWGLKNQEKIHYAMPLRHMIADSLIYLKEYNEIAAKNKKEKNYSTPDEFLSALKKEDRLHPVISLCIYYGQQDWDGPFNLMDMLVIPEYLKPLVSDYKMNLIQVRKSDDLYFKNQDINNLFELIRSIYNKDYESFQRMYKDKKLSTELGLTLGSVVNSQAIIKQVLAEKEKGSDSNMTDPFVEMLEEMKKQEGKKAKIEGTIHTCKKFHINENDTLKNLIEEFALSEDKAREYMNMYW